MGTDFSAFLPELVGNQSNIPSAGLVQSFNQATSYFSAPDPGREGVVNDLVAGMFGGPKGFGSQ